MFNIVALSNLVYDRIRLLIGVVGVAFAVLLVFINLGFLGALSETAGSLYNHLDAEVYLVSPLSVNGTTTKPFGRERLYQAMGQADVVQAMPLYIGYLPWRNPETHQEFFILGFGFNPTDRPFQLPEVQDQAAIEALNQPNTVFLDRRSLPKYGAHQVGLSTEFNKRSVTVNGLFTLGGGMAAEATLLMSEQNFLRYYSPRALDYIDLGLIKLRPGANVHQAVLELRQRLPLDTAVFTKREMIERDRQYWLETTAVGFIFNLGVGAALIIGAAIVYQILYADISKNFKEYATLKAIGFHNRFLMTVVLQEAVLLAVMGFVPGLILALGTYQLILYLTNESIPMVMPLARVGLVLVLAIVTCILSGLLSMRKILVADPANVL
jgi:putative ABC transport system permease protein